LLEVFNPAFIKSQKMMNNSENIRRMRMERAARSTQQHLQHLQQTGVSVKSNRSIHLHEHSAETRSVQQMIPLCQDDIDYYNNLEKSGRLEAIYHYKKSVGIDVSDIETLYPSKYAPKTPPAVQYEREQLIDAVSTFLEVEPVDVVKVVIEDIDTQDWIGKVDEGVFWAPPSHFVNGVAYEGMRSVYDTVADIIIENTDIENLGGGEDSIDIVYVPGWRDSMQGYFSGRETKVVAIPPDESWVDVYFLSTFMPLHEFTNMICDIRRGYMQGAENMTRCALGLLYEIPHGVTPRGLNYVVLQSSVPETSRERFMACLKEGWYDECPVLVNYGAMAHAWEVGSSLVVVDLYNSVALYFSASYVKRFF